MLIVGGDLDSLTPLSDAQVFGPTLGRNVRVVTLPNTVHVTSEGDTMLVAGASCARRVIRAFVRAPGKLQSLDTGCAGHIPPVHTPGSYPLNLADATPATLAAGPDPGVQARRAAIVAAGALADATIRRFYLGADSEDSPGLRGGTFTTAGEDPMRLKLTGIRFVRDATVGGRATWRPSTGALSAKLVVRATGSPATRVAVSWKQRSRLATARVGAATLTLAAP
jgi:hypothetical protein